MEATGARRVGAGGDTTTGTGKKPRSLAQLFCLIFGLVLIAVGILGFFYDNGADFALPDSLEPGARGEILGLLDTNGWHNVVHLASGALLLFASPRAALARTVALVFGLTYVVVTIWGVIDTESVFELIPVNDEDNILHAALAAAGLLAALLPTRHPEDRDRSAAA